MTPHGMRHPELGARSPRRRRCRHWRTALVLPVVIAILQLAGPQPTASAHDRLVSSSPAADTVVAGSPVEIRLIFSEPITPGFAAATLAVDDGPPRPMDLRVDGTTLIAIPPTSSPVSVQRWTVAYRIVSNDGHPIVDELQFRVTPSEAPGTRRSGQPEDHSTGSPPQLPAADAPTPRPDRRWLVAVAAALVVIGVTTTVRARRGTARHRARSQ